MDLENHNTKETYVLLMCETLRKKLDVLNQLMLLTKQQEQLISGDQFDEDQFDQIITSKEEQLETLAKLDNGFERIYDSMKEELNLNKDLYKSKISEIQKYITDITDLSINLQALEKRNKTKIELLFTTKRKEIRTSRMNGQTATNYYKTMAKQHETQAYFYDEKK